MPGGHTAFGGEGSFHFVHFERDEGVVVVAVGVVVGDEGAGFFSASFGNEPGAVGSVWRVMMLDERGD